MFHGKENLYKIFQGALKEETIFLTSCFQATIDIVFINIRRKRPQTLISDFMFGLLIAFTVLKELHIWIARFYVTAMLAFMVSLHFFRVVSGIRSKNIVAKCEYCASISIKALIPLQWPIEHVKGILQLIQVCNLIYQGARNNCSILDWMKFLTL